MCGLICQDIPTFRRVKTIYLHQKYPHYTLKQNNTCLGINLQEYYIHHLFFCDFLLGGNLTCLCTSRAARLQYDSAWLLSTDIEILNALYRER